MKLLLFSSYRGWSHGRKWLEYLSKKHEVHLATFKDFGEQLPDVKIHPILGQAASSEKNQIHNAAQRETPWLTLRIGYKFANKFGRVIDELRPDLVHAHQSIPFGWYAVKAIQASQTKPPLIVSVWGTDVLAFPERYFVYRWINRRVLQKAKVVTATSKYLKKATQKWSPRSSIRIVPFGVDTALFKPRKEISDEVHVFGMAKQLKADIYGIEMAIQALALARKQADFRLELAGIGPAKKYFEAIATKLGVLPYVTFLGEVKQDKLPAVMANWDGYLMPSRQESFGVAALEAQAVGLPVLASRVGGIPEVVRENITARFIEPLDISTLAKTMLDLQHNRLLRDSALVEGPRWVRSNYEWQDCGKKMESIYAALK